MNVHQQPVSAAELAKSARSHPPLPRTTSQIILILGDPLFDVQDLIKVITSLDPTLTANLLRAANSASYCTARPAASVGDAVVRLGTGTIMAYALSVSARPQPEVDLSPFGLTTEEYWRHCIASVAAAEELKSRGLARFGSGFSAAALLHDIGKLLPCPAFDARTPGAIHGLLRQPSRAQNDRCGKRISWSKPRHSWCSGGRKLEPAERYCGGHQKPSRCVKMERAHVQRRHSRKPDRN